VTATLLVAAVVGAGAVSPAANAATPIPANFVLAGFGTASGWSFDKHVRILADITGDKRADIVGFGENGVATSIATGSGGFAPAQLVLNDFSYDRGWRVGVHSRFVVDITGDGRADLVGLGNAGVYTAVATGSGAFGPFTFQPGTFSAGQCLGPSRTDGNGSETVYTGNARAVDVNGDKRTDLVCVHDHDIKVALARGDGGFAAPVVATTELSQFQSAFVDLGLDGRADLLMQAQNFPAVLAARARADGTFGPAIFSGNFGVPIQSLYVDVNGDGFRDMVSFNTTTLVASGRGDGTFGPLSLAHPGFGLNDGWAAQHPRLVADITGDGRADIVGFGNAGVYTAVANGGYKFGPAQFVVAGLGYNQFWRMDQHIRSLADITGDGRADIVAFGDAGVYTAVSNGDGTFR
jgi:hypothetical protein